MTKKYLEMMEMTLLFVVMIWEAYTYVKLHQLYTLDIDTLIHVNYLSIKTVSKLDRRYCVCLFVL